MGSYIDSEAMTRYDTVVEDGTIYVGSDDGRIRVGELDDVLDVLGGPAWTITYSAAEKERHPGMNTADEGLTVDVVDVIHAMTHGEQFVKSLAAQPGEASDDAALPPRTGLFVGKLLENLENGVA
jgi:hypothetical protein